MRETLLLEVLHRQVVSTIPKRLRVFFKFKRRFLGDLCRCALRALTRYFEVVTGSVLTPSVIAAINYRTEDGLLIRAKRSARFVR